MIVARAELVPCVMRKQDPKWRFALGASPTTSGVIVRIVGEDGTEGVGYGSATAHLGAPQEKLVAALERLVPLVVGCDAEAIDDVLARLDHTLPGCNQAKAAIECALHDLAARASGVPLHRLLGGKIRDWVPILRILAIKSPDAMAAEAVKLISKGYRYLKIKVEGDVDLDVARVRAIRREVGDGVHLTIDANQAYDAADAIAALSRMAEFGVDLAEQPVKADDLDGLKRVTDSVPMIVEADESADSFARIDALVGRRIVDSVSLKVPKLGGLRATIEAARLCDAGGVGYRMGAAVGSRLLAAQAMHLAATLPRLDYACELGEFDRLLDDPFEGVEIEEGRLHLPAGLGSGVVWRKDNEEKEAAPCTSAASI